MGRPPPEPLCVMKGNMTPVHSLLFDLSPEKELLYAGTQNGVIHIWDLQLNRECGTLKPGDQTCLMMCRLGHSLITQDKECSVKIWDNANGSFKCKNRIEQSKHVTFCKMQMVAYDNTDILIIPSAEGEIKLYSAYDCKLLHSFKKTLLKGQKLGEVMVINAVESSNTLYILVAYEGGALLLWDIRSCDIVSDITFNNELPLAIDYVSDHKVGICGTNSDNLHVFNITENQEIIKKRSIPLKNPGINCIKIRHDNKIFAVGCWDSKLRIYSFKTYNLLAVLEYHENSILYVCFSHVPVSSWNCNNLLVSGAMDKKISLWDIYN